MLKPIPRNASTFTIPNVGEVAVYQIGSWWWAVYTAANDARREPVGMGTTVADAVAKLLGAA